MTRLTEFDCDNGYTFTADHWGGLVYTSFRHRTNPQVVIRFRADDIDSAYQVIVDNASAIALVGYAISAFEEDSQTAFDFAGDA